MQSSGVIKIGKTEAILRILVIIGIGLLFIKYIFFDFDVDTEYAIALSYRLAKGDHMFLEMWEPHQTSAFACAFFIKIWLALTGTTTGIVVYLHVMSLLVKLVIGAVLHKTLKRYFDRNVVFFGIALFLAVNPKMLLLEFSNLQLYASVLLFCFLLKYLEEKRLVYLFLASIAMCLEVLAYPSCLIVYVLVVGLLLAYSESKVQDVLIFSLVCGISGACYVFYFVFHLGFDKFMECLQAIAMGDGSHSAGLGEKFLLYGQDALWLLGIYFLCAFGAALFFVIRKKHFVPAFFVLLLCFGMCNLFIKVSYYGDMTKLTRAINGMTAELYPPFMFLGWVCLKNCDALERMTYKIGTMLSLGGFFATLLLTNLNIYKSLDYLVLGAVAAFVPVCATIQKQTNVSKGNGFYVLCFLGLISLMLKSGYLIRNNFPEYINTNVLQVKNIVKKGPAKGIVSTYMWPYISNVSIPEWDNAVQDGDRVMIVGAGPVNTLPYLYKDVEICVDSTICTPTYTEKMLKYWEMNPEKKPNVVVVDCWFGRPLVGEDTWIMKWIAGEFGEASYTDGTYYRFYRK